MEIKTEAIIVRRKRTRNSPFAFPMTMTLLAMASWETIWRRSFLIAQGTCTLAEYRRMAEEKAVALQMSTAGFHCGTRPSRGSGPVCKSSAGEREATPSNGLTDKGRVR
jgi:hypothetical protein